jgi:hypothetical protein
MGVYWGYMKKSNFYLTDRQLQGLEVIKNKTGLPMAEIVRRAIDKFLKGFKGDR